MIIPIFVHVPKTAGSSLRTLFAANYSEEQLLSVYGNHQEIRSQCQLHAGKTAGFRLIQGHIPYGVHQYFGERTASYFCFLREPVARTLSDIAFAQRTPSHGFHKSFADPALTLSQRLREASRISYYRDNMTHYISGTFFAREITALEYGKAVDNLRNSAFVGITENFEASLLIMARRLGWRYVVPQVSNVSAEKDTLPNTDHHMDCRAFLDYDLHLYDVAQELFDKQIRRYGQELSEAVDQLREILQAQRRKNPDTIYKEYRMGMPLASPTHMPAKDSPLARWIAESTSHPK